MTTSQEWWPADYGHYGPLFIRMAWHAAGTYRIADGRGGGGSGAQRFAPLNSWPDNANLDKARRLLWPVKQKYGRKISWADLIVFAGNVALESMGFETFGFGVRPRGHLGARGGHLLGPRGRRGSATSATAATASSPSPLGAVQMGLIYVNPEGPNGNPDPLAAAPGHPRDVRPHGDERRGDRRAHRRRPHVRQDATAPATADLRRPRARGVRRSSSRASAGSAATAPARAATRSPAASRARGRTTPTKWDNGFFENLYGYEWELTKSPAGAKQWTPTDDGAGDTVPDAHDPSKRARADDADDRPRAADGPGLRRRSRGASTRTPTEFADAFAKAWFKLLHRDMGPIARYLGPLGPAEPQLWQDPVPAVDHELVGDADIAALKAQDPRVGAVGLAAGVDRVGVGVDVPRHRQARRRQRRPHPPRTAEGLGRSTSPAELAEVLSTLEGIQQDFNGSQSGGKQGLARRPDRPRRRAPRSRRRRRTPATT